MKKNKIKTEKSKKQSVKTFTKKWINIILSISLLDVQFVFVLAFLGKDQIAETLGIALITEIVAVAIAYMCRAFFDSHTEAKDNIEMEKIKRDYNVNNNHNDVGSNEAVG